MAGVGSWEWEVKTGAMRWSEQMCCMLGVATSAKASFEALLAFAHPDDQARVRAQLEQSVAENRAYSAEFRIVRGDGAEISVSAYPELMEDTGGHQRRVTGVLHDVTGRAEAAERLRVSEERFQMVARATRDVIWDVQLRGAVNDVADDPRRIGDLVGGAEFWISDSIRGFGYDVAGVTLAWLLERVHPSDREVVVYAIHHALAGTGTSWSVEYRFRRADGSYADIFDRAHMLRDAKGAVVGAIGSMQDVSARKEAERRQESSLKELEEANRQLAEFAYVVSHDLKAPLRGISSLADWIVRDSGDKLDDEGREQLGLLLVRVRRMNDLVEGILQYSRVGRANEERSSVALAELVPQIVDLIGAPSHVTVEIEGALPVVVAPRTQIAQVFQNLVGNAVKFCDPSCGRVVVACSERGDRWQFEIKDNGRGIEERHFERIFQLFQTLGSRDKNGSTGIGLTIVKKIVESTGGRVWLESRIGEGSRFFFTLPKTSENP